MRVAFALSGSDYGRSGIGTYVKAVLPRMRAALDRTGDSIVVLGTERDFEAYAAEIDDLPREPLRAFELPAANALYYFGMIARHTKRARASVLFLPAANRRMPVYAGVPSVAVVHDLAQLHVREKYDPLRMQYFQRLVVPALRRAARLVAISRATELDLTGALGDAHPPIVIVPNGVDHERFAPRSEDDVTIVDARRAVGIERSYLLYASRLEHPGKNHLRLLEAYATSQARQGHELVLAGKDWGAEAAIRESIAKLGLKRDVRLAGFVDDAHMPGLVAGAHVVLMLGLREGFGLPALEAIAAGRTVCAADAGALPEVVGPLAALCDPLDVASIRAAIDRASSDTILRRRVQREGPDWARARSWESTVDKLVATCREVSQ